MHNFCEGLSLLMIPTGTYIQPAQRSVNSSATMCGSVRDSVRQCGRAAVCGSVAVQQFVAVLQCGSVQ